MTEDIMVTQAMDILIHAGDSRNATMKALDAIAVSNYEEARMLLETAHKEIVLAHNAQTLVLQGIAAEEYPEKYSILFSHAQDTLMTVYSEYNIAVKMMQIIENMERKIMKTGGNEHV